MITIVCGTNRTGSKALEVSSIIKQILADLGEENIEVVNLRTIQHDLITDDMYEAHGQSPVVKKVQDELMINADKWIFVIPEYNGSYPGVFKLFLDALSVRNYKKTFNDRKVAMVGIADGRGGNLRGLDQLTNSMHYLGSNVYRNKLPISQLEKSFSEGTLIKPVLEDLKNMIKDFLAY